VFFPLSNIVPAHVTLVFPFKDRTIDRIFVSS
jgi:hypothetical protein